ncbi:MAG: hypothetical protein U0871_08855 [Gemmataceae bacterium]
MRRLIVWGMVCAAAGGYAVSRPAAEPPADPVPGLRAGGDPRANTAALQRLLDTGKEPITITPGPGEYRLAGAVRWPCDRTVTLDLGGHATLVQTAPGEPLIRFHRGSPDGWHRQATVIRNGRLVGGPGGAAVLATDNTGPLDPRFHTLLLADLLFATSPASADRPGYAIDFVTDYSVLPRLVRCESGFGPLVRWRPGRAEPHATSALVIDQCRAHVAAANRYAPDLWLNGHRNLTVRNTIIEGGWGYAPGADPAAHDGATGLLIDNPGPQVTTVEHCWFEHWGDRPKDQYQWVVRNPFPKAAGAHQPRAVRVVASGGVGLAVNKSADDPFTLYSLWPLASGQAEVRGLVDLVERDAPNLWQQEGPAESGSQHESPTLTGRREPAPSPVYVFPGGTGHDGGGLDRAAAAAFPHRHPAYGSCLAVRGSGPVFTLPDHRRPDERRLYSRVLAAAPHHARQGGGADGLWVRLTVAGGDVFRVVPDGFAPAELAWSAPGSDARPGGLLAVGDWYSRPRDGKYATPARPWVLVYAASAAYGRPAPIAPHYGPTVSHEWKPGAGPPPGTYGRGDVVIGADRTHRCTTAGTSRPVAVTTDLAAGSAELRDATGLVDLLEGDWLTGPGLGGAYRVRAIRADGVVRLDRPVPITRAKAALSNSPPQWAVAR